MTDKEREKFMQDDQLNMDLLKKAIKKVVKKDLEKIAGDNQPLFKAKIFESPTYTGNVRMVTISLRKNDQVKDVSKKIKKGLTDMRDYNIFFNSAMFSHSDQSAKKTLHSITAYEDLLKEAKSLQKKYDKFLDKQRQEYEKISAVPGDMETLPFNICDLSKEDFSENSENQEEDYNFEDEEMDLD